MDKNEENTDLAKWAENSLSEDKVKELAKKVDLSKLENSLERLNSYGYKKGNIEDAWNNLEKKLEERKNLKKIKIIPLFLKIAVSVILIFSTYYLFIYENYITVKTEFAQTKNVYLPDSTLIKLNSGSEIKYKTKNWEENRAVELSGEAYFEVTKGSKFIVETKLANLEVVGTSFNIKVRENSYNAQCFSGTVKVYYSGKQKTLKKGNAVKIVNNSLIQYNFEEINVDWLQNKLVFKDTKLADVFKELQINYNFVFKAKDKSIYNKVFSGQVPNNNLEGAVLIIAKAMSLEYEINKQNNTVVFYFSE